MPGNSEAAYDDAIRSMFTLMTAGRPTGVGHAYEGTFDRLVRIYETSPVNRLRVRALSALPATTRRKDALLYLRTVAVSKTPYANTAVSALLEDSRGGVPGSPPLSPAEREQSLTILRDLASQHLVVDPSTARDLDVWYTAPERVKH